MRGRVTYKDGLILSPSLAAEAAAQRQRTVSADEHRGMLPHTLGFCTRFGLALQHTQCLNGQGGGITINATAWGSVREDAS